MKILDHHQIEQKIKRLAIEIYESNYEQKDIIFAGINNNGLYFAKLLQAEFERQAPIPSKVVQINVNPASPLSDPIVIDIDTDELSGATIIVVDDVANTGRTAFFALKPFFSILPEKMEIAVLVDRKHKSFPIRPDYVGLSLATTLKEHIRVELKTDEMAVYLD